MSAVRRTLVLVVSVALLVSATLPVRAQTDLQDAKNEAEEAEADLGRARSSVGIQRAQLDETGAALAVAFEEFTARNQELEALTLKVLSLEEGTRQVEGELSRVRTRALDQAVEIYTSSISGSGLFSLLAGATPAEAVIAVGLLDDVAEGEQSEVANYIALRSDLDRRRERLEEDRASLADVRDAVEIEKQTLERLYAEAAEDLAAAEARVRAADAEYRSALDAIETERRRLAMLRGAESWRPIVEIYFPEWLVQEALVIIQCESRGNPDAVNPRSSASGLFQFLDSTWSWASVRAGFGGTSRFDPEANIAVAAWLVDASIQTNHRYGRWGPWECRREIYPPYTNGQAAPMNEQGVIPVAARLEEDPLV